MRAKQAGCCSKINSSYLSEIEFLGEGEHSDQGQNMESLPHEPDVQQSNRSLLPVPIILLRLVWVLLHPSTTKALGTDTAFPLASAVGAPFIPFGYCCLKWTPYIQFLVLGSERILPFSVSTHRLTPAAAVWKLPHPQSADTDGFNQISILLWSQNHLNCAVTL